MLLIKNGCVLDPKTGFEGKKDILIDEDKILRIADDIDAEGCEVIDAAGCFAAPGLVDTHVHFREPGFTAKEDIDTGAAAAAKGGYTSVVMMANTKPAIDNPETLNYVLTRGAGTPIHVYACANVTMGMQGKEIAPLEELAAAGAVGFTDDGLPLMDADLVRTAMRKTGALNMPLSFHEEDPTLIANNGINRGKASEFYGIGGSPREAEITLAKRDIALCAETGASVTIQHISARETVDMIREAKAAGVNVHGEATPHHFTLTEEAAIKYGTLAKMNPPLREEADRQAIIAGLADGTLDVIATDHAPHTAEEKAKEITAAPSGIIGLETALSLGIMKLVEEGPMNMLTLIERMSTGPAKLYGLDAGYLAEGGPADIVIIDPKATYIAGNYASKASNSPFTGQELRGRVMATICAGKVVYSV